MREKKDLSPSVRRVSELLHGVLTELRNAEEPIGSTELFRRAEPKLNLTEHERSLNKTGYPRWETNVLWYSVGPVKAGFLEKTGGKWSLTEAGKKALRQTPEQFYREVDEKYKQWESQEKSDSQDVPKVDDDDESVQVQATYEKAIDQAQRGIEEFITSMDEFDIQEAVAELLIAMGYHISFVA